MPNVLNTLKIGDATYPLALPYFSTNYSGTPAVLAEDVGNFAFEAGSMAIIDFKVRNQGLSTLGLSLMWEDSDNSIALDKNQTADFLGPTLIVLTSATTFRAMSLNVSNAVSDAIADLVGTASENLDTIYELADAVSKNQGVIETLNKAITDKSNKTHTHSFSGIQSDTEAGGGGNTKPTNILYTPEGEVSLTITEDATNGNYTPSGKIGTVEGHTHSVNALSVYTPQGIISSHHHELVTKTTKLSFCTGVSGDYDSETKTLTIAPQLGESTFTSLLKLTTGETQPTFTGTEATINVIGNTNSAGGHLHSFTGKKVLVSGTFTGEELSLAHSHNINEHSHTYVPQGTISTAAE